MCDTIHIPQENMVIHLGKKFRQNENETIGLGLKP